MKKKKRIKYKNIRLHKDTYNFLKKHKKGKETFNVLIYNILKNKK